MSSKAAAGAAVTFTTGMSANRQRAPLHEIVRAWSPSKKVILYFGSACAAACSTQACCSVSNAGSARRACRMAISTIHRSRPCAGFSCGSRGGMCGSLSKSATGLGCAGPVCSNQLFVYPGNNNNNIAVRGSNMRLFAPPRTANRPAPTQRATKSCCWALRRMRCVHPPGTPHSVTHDVTSASIDYNETDGVIGLVAETLRPIRRDMPHLANERRLPFAPHQSLDAQRLAWEYNETLLFRSKHLAQDPRARPDWVIVDLGHNERCTSCEQDAGLQQSLHGSEVIDIGGRTQLLVDDWAVHSWQNVARVLEPPQEKRAFDIRTSDENKYGCPCSSMETEDGRVTLIYNGGDVHARRTSADGVTDWSDPEPVLINGRPAFGNHDSELGTLDVVPTPSLLSRNPSAGRQKLLYLGGYQGRSGTACIASSSDGRAFDTMASTHDVNGGSQHWDRRTCQGSVHSALGRAGDTYVHLLVDPARQRELVWYRSEFGTPSGWREIRGIRVAELNQRFADIDNGTAQLEC